MLTAGRRLRNLREQLGLTMRQVEAASVRIAADRSNPEFAIPISRLCEVESRGVVPSIFRLYSLSAIYRRNPVELFSWYGVDLGDTSLDAHSAAPARTHLNHAVSTLNSARLPLQLKPEFDLRRTANLGALIETWGVVPLAHLSRVVDQRYTYGYIGLEDLTMYPLLLPGSFVQIDESRNRVLEGPWPSEYERPIYFVELRDGHTCCWCSLRGDQIVLQPHPLSPVAPRVLRHGREAEVLGSVVGVAMRLGRNGAANGRKHVLKTA